MKFLLSIVLLLPIVFAASIEKRIIFGQPATPPPVDAVANMLMNTLGSDWTRNHCVNTLCPSIFVKLNMEPFQNMLCTPVCDQLQTLIKNQVANIDFGAFGR